MKFKVGDKVKFLNEKGGGVVSKIVSSSMVLVATEDGFEMPTSSGDIILLNAESKAEKMFSENFNVDLNKTISERTTSSDDPATGKIKPGAEESRGFYLAFVPSDQQWFMTGDLELRLINHSYNDILYNILLQDDDEDYFGFDYGSVEAGSFITIETIEREQLPEWTDGMIQLMVHAEDDAFQPLQCSFHFKASKFSSEGSYQKSGLIKEAAIIFKLADLKSVKRLPKKHEMAKMIDEPIEVKAVEHKKESLIGKHATGPHAAVVDLHIGEIVDNIAGLSSHDMFLLQIGYFTSTLDSAMKNNFRKVTYIHGVGNGVLKNAIIEKLKDYQGLENKSASLAEYGQGAVDVLLHYR